MMSKGCAPILWLSLLATAAAGATIDKAPGATSPPLRWMADSVYTYEYKASSTVSSEERFHEVQPSGGLSVKAAPRDEGNAGRVECTVELDICCGRATLAGGWEVTASMRLRNVTLARDVRASVLVSNAEIIAALERGDTVFPMRSDGTSDVARLRPPAAGGAGEASRSADAAAAPLKRSIVDAFRFIDPATTDGAGELDGFGSSASYKRVETDGSIRWKASYAIKSGGRLVRRKSEIVPLTPDQYLVQRPGSPIEPSGAAEADVRRGAVCEMQVADRTATMRAIDCTEQLVARHGNLVPANLRGPGGRPSGSGAMVVVTRMSASLMEIRERNQVGRKSTECASACLSWHLAGNTGEELALVETGSLELAKSLSFPRPPVDCKKIKDKDKCRSAAPQCEWIKGRMYGGTCKQASRFRSSRTELRQQVGLGSGVDADQSMRVLENIDDVLEEGGASPNPNGGSVLDGPDGPGAGGGGGPGKGGKTNGGPPGHMPSPLVGGPFGPKLPTLYNPKR